MINMRADLVEDGFMIPAYFDVADDKVIYLTADEVAGAVMIDDNSDDTRPEYNYEHILLNDGRMVYVYGIDLE